MHGRQRPPARIRLSCVCAQGNHGLGRYAALSCALIAGALGWLPLGYGVDKHNHIDVGLRKQLLVDDLVIASKTGLTRELGQATKANGGKPIFTDGRFYGTGLYDQNRFKLWYRKNSNDGYGYAESADGEHFEKRADLTGINFAGDFTLSVMIDPHESDPAHRYKGAYDGPGMAAAIAYSSDGIRWTPYNEGRPVTGRAADTYNQILWDEAAGTYRLLTRTDIGTPGGSTEIRGTRGMVNADVKGRPTAWRTVRSWHFNREGAGEHKRRQIYALSDWIYEGVHFALMSVYEWPGDGSEGGEDLKKRHERDVMNLYIATSRDGDQWDLTWVYTGQPIIPRGPSGSFDKDTILSASTVVTHRERHWVYYCGANERHGTEQVHYPERKLAIGLATFRLDGLIGLRAREEGGTLVTKPFRLEGGKLVLNVDARQGACVVEVTDEGGARIPGFGRDEAIAATGVDELQFRPRWKEHPDVARLRGRIVRLGIYLRRARLYSFQVLP
jgi:hypothetical protein